MILERRDREIGVGAHDARLRRRRDVSGAGCARDGGVRRRLIEAPHAGADQGDDQRARGAACDRVPAARPRLLRGVPVDQRLVAETRGGRRGAGIEPLEARDQLV